MSPSTKWKCGSALSRSDGVGADVHAVDLVAPVAQQAFGQVVADEAVDPEDQHPRAALRAGRRATQARALDQAQLGGQLRAGQVQAALAALAEAQHQRVLAAGDPQRVAGQYAARLATVVAGDHLGAPDDQLLFADLAEGARVGLGHRARPGRTTAVPACASRAGRPPGCAGRSGWPGSRPARLPAARRGLAAAGCRAAGHRRPCAACRAGSGRCPRGRWRRPAGRGSARRRRARSCDAGSPRSAFRR